MHQSEGRTTQTAPTRGARPRRVLITQGSLFAIAGSEMVSFELAQYFAESGDDVLVVTYGVAQLWMEEFDAIGVPVVRYDSADIDDRVEIFDPNVVWVHHQVVPQVLLRKPEGRRFIFHHMSIVHPMEFPIMSRVETALAGAVAFVSQEAMDFHKQTRLLDGVPEGRWHVLGNPAPLAYFDRTTPADAADAVVVISNHPPAELLEAVRALHGRLAIASVGDHADGVPRRIGPQDIAGASALVSIGKSVQYALAMGVPVYVYDHFGGPGWLTQSNFERARYHNFSGRGFERKSSVEVAEELAVCPPAARELAGRAAAEFADILRIDVAVERLIEHAPAVDGADLLEVDLYAFSQEMTLRNGLVNAIEARAQSLELATRRLDALAASASRRDSVVRRLRRLLHNRADRARPH